MEANVELFGKQITAVRMEDGRVMFERKPFVNALGKARAMRIFKEMNELLEFLGEDGADQIMEAGSDTLCNFLLTHPHASEELRDYATAWATACVILKGGE